MARKSRPAAPGGRGQASQWAPSSVVRSTVAPEPLAQAVPPPTLWIPWRLARVWESWISHWPCALSLGASRSRARSTGRFMANSVADADGFGGGFEGRPNRFGFEAVGGSRDGDMGI